MGMENFASYLETRIEIAAYYTYTIYCVHIQYIICTTHTHAHVMFNKMKDTVQKYNVTRLI